MIPRPSRVPTRILVVDDSALMRTLLRRVICSDSNLEVVGSASDGAQALQAIETLRPDLVLLDVEMPVMDGLNTLRQMRLRGNLAPVIMCSALTQHGARVTLEALASGAADYIAKPSGQLSREAAVEALARELIPRIHALTGTRHSLCATLPEIPSDASARPATPQNSKPPAVVVLGVSTGGPEALDVLLTKFPSSFPLPILVVQHMPELFTRLLAERLRTRCQLPVSEAVSGRAVQPGSITIARGNWHLELHQLAGSRVPILRLNQEAGENYCRPSVDVLFRTAAEVYGAATLGVILTGMGSDGLAGCRFIRERGGTILAQDQATSAVWGMPGAVVQAGIAHRVLPLEAIAAEILRLTRSSQYEAPQLRESAR